MHTRRQTRILCMQLLYSMDIHSDFSTQKIEDQLFKIDKEKNIQYASSVLEETSKHLEEIDQKIQSALKDWTIQTLSRVDLAIMRLSVTEILYLKDIPTQVSISEAIELAKEFSTPDSPSFINGVLGTISDRYENA